MRFSPKLYRLAIVHSIFYILTGVWPLVHINSFIWVTGPKYDLWLVKTVGVIILVVGVVILLAGKNKRITWEIMLLATGCAAALTIIDIYYVAVNRIWPVYLADALAEIGLTVFWVIFWVKAPPAS
jgi:hypothetical protein